jgi:hypothetical protein
MAGIRPRQLELIQPLQRSLQQFANSCAHLHRLGVTLAALLACTGCGDGASPTTTAVGPHARVVSSGDYSGEWPFGPDRGVLRCRRLEPDRLVTFEAEGVTYGLNAAARRRGSENVRAILLTDHAGLPFDYSPVLRDGLALCG